MFKNYFKTAWRNLIKSKGYSAINIGGLTVCRPVAMLIGLWLYDELNFDKFHTNYNRIAQVILSCAIAAPIAYYYLGSWLGN